MTIAIVTSNRFIDSEAWGMTAPTVFDGMLEAQIEFGQVTWDVLHHSMACGFVGLTEDATNRIAVFDLDAADGMNVLRVTNYVLGHTDEFPELA
jgi:hypothetical protein